MRIKISILVGDRRDEYNYVDVLSVEFVKDWYKITCKDGARFFHPLDQIVRIGEYK